MNQDAIMTPVVEATQLAGTVNDLSIWTLLMQADPVVQAVMVLLLLASLWCWAIIFSKLSLYRRARSMAESFENDFWSAQSLDEFYLRMKDAADHPMAVLFVTAMAEWKRSAAGRAKGSLGAYLPERIDRVLRVALNREMEHLEKNLSFLATVGSIAPFVGLFGTVWGIMGSFRSIAQSSDTSLAVVAPGIAEALFATAMGLLAAIPAVLAYNAFATDMARFATRMEGFVDEFNALLSRQIDGAKS